MDGGGDGDKRLLVLFQKVNVLDMNGILRSQKNIIFRFVQSDIARALQQPLVQKEFIKRYS